MPVEPRVQKRLDGLHVAHLVGKIGGIGRLRKGERAAIGLAQRGGHLVPPQVLQERFARGLRIDQGNPDHVKRPANRINKWRTRPFNEKLLLNLGGLARHAPLFTPSLHQVTTLDLLAYASELAETRCQTHTAFMFYKHASLSLSSFTLANIILNQIAETLIM